MNDGAAPEAPARSLTRVSDLDLAAYLLHQGAELVRVVPTLDPARHEFELRAPQGMIVEGVRRFVGGEARVEPRRFAFARRKLQRALRGYQ